jgi:undecaprenyl-diphosphatase
MNWLEAIGLGLIQGITEILPVSSDGHLALLLQYWQLPPAIRLNLTAALHLGTALAILVYMSGRVKNIVRDLFSPAAEIKNAARRLVLMLVIAALPVVISGLLLEDSVARLFNRMQLIALLFIVNGTLLFLTRFFRPAPRPITPLRALLIGLIQTTALLPAISRSGTTISLALLMGVNAAEAFEFSFLLALPVTLGAALFELLKIDFTALSPGMVLVGIASAGLSGVLMLIFLRKLVVSRNFFWFGVYCWIIGLATLIFSR